MTLSRNAIAPRRKRNLESLSSEMAEIIPEKEILMNELSSGNAVSFLLSSFEVNEYQMLKSKGMKYRSSQLASSDRWGNSESKLDERK